jgi:hypothetical protein
MLASDFGADWRRRRERREAFITSRWGCWGSRERTSREVFDGGRSCDVSRGARLGIMTMSLRDHSTVAGSPTGTRLSLPMRGIQDVVEGVGVESSID